jgi:hypothetical protein
VAFADIGPSPANPDITVTFTKGGEVFTAPLSVVWRCNEPLYGDDNENSSMGQRNVALACQMGVCTNENWYYKLNPCFDASDGYLLYKEATESTHRKTGSISFEEGGGSMTVDLDTDKVSGPSPVKPGAELCIPALILLSSVCLIFMRSE